MKEMIKINLNFKVDDRTMIHPKFYKKNKPNEAQIDQDMDLEREKLNLGSFENFSKNSTKVG